MKLIIVDDDETLCRTLARRFTQQGYEAHYYFQPTSVEALIAQQATHYLLDMRFSEQSGLTFVEPLRQALPDCRIIMLTGYASIASAVQAVKMGADDYLTKPTDFASLLSAVTGDTQNQAEMREDRKSTRLNSSHVRISYAVFCLKKKKKKKKENTR